MSPCVAQSISRQLSCRRWTQRHVTSSTHRGLVGRPESSQHAYVYQDSRHHTNCRVHNICTATTDFHAAWSCVLTLQPCRACVSRNQRTRVISLPRPLPHGTRYVRLTVCRHMPSFLRRSSLITGRLADRSRRCQGGNVHLPSFLCSYSRLLPLHRGPGSTRA